MRDNHDRKLPQLGQLYDLSGGDQLVQQGHIEVDQEKIRANFACLSGGVSSVISPNHAVSVENEHTVQVRRRVGVVFDDQYERVRCDNFLEVETLHLISGQ
jgi:hypothetical protein